MSSPIRRGISGIDNWKYLRHTETYGQKASFMCDGQGKSGDLNAFICFYLFVFFLFAFNGVESNEL